jgi:hypothetical protein
MRLMLLVVACATTEIDESRCCAPEKTFAVAAPPETCVQAAQALLPSDDAWKRLWSCVQAGHFTELRELLTGAWDRDLRTRPDAPLLILYVIAQRGGAVDEDLPRLHQRRVPLFSLSQAIARPALYQGALIIVRARLAEPGMLDEMRVVGRATEARIGLDSPTGQRMVAALGDPFIEEDDSVVLLARFDGLRDGWPELSVVGHALPAATLAD